MAKLTLRANIVLLICMLIVVFLIGACSTVYYGAMEKVGVHKRDILVDRVEEARDSQTEAQKQFKSALEEFAFVIQATDTDLKQAYEKMDSAYQDSKNAAEEVSNRIDKVESVADALFVEWEKELDLYQSAELRRSSGEKLKQTKRRYKTMLTNMQRAENSMTPVLSAFQDNVLFLKHNLNAQAIGSLRSEFSNLQGKIDGLMMKMKASIDESNRFIASLKK
jgi:DNA repair exonuclease SbcCD ATPase subunit